MDDRLGAVPGQVQQRRLVGQPAQLRRRQAAARSAPTPTWDAGAQVKAQNWDSGRAIITYKPSAAAGSTASRSAGRRCRRRRSRPSSTPRRRRAQPARRAARRRPSARSACASCAATPATSRAAAPSSAVRGAAVQEPRTRRRSATSSTRRRTTSARRNFGYYDDFEAAPLQRLRRRLPRAARRCIYMGANDGMLHAINATTGAEMFAYVPSPVYAALPQLTDLDYAPPLLRRRLADRRRRVLRRRLAHAAGLRHARRRARACSRSTSPIRPASPRPTPRAIVRWEFQDADMGYVFGQPLLVKTNNGRWSVDRQRRLQRRQRQRPRLPVRHRRRDRHTGRARSTPAPARRRARTACRRRRRSTSTATASPTSSTPATSTATSGSSTCSARRPAAGRSATAACRCSTPAPGTPITGRPDVTRFTAGGFLVAFGTGRYIATADNADLTHAAHLRRARHRHHRHGRRSRSLLQQTILGTTRTGADGNNYRFSTHAVGPPKDYAGAGDNTIAKATYLSDKRGWYLDLPDGGRARRRRRALPRRPRDLHVDRPRRQLAVRLRRLRLGDRVRRDDRQPLRQRDLRHQRRQHPDHGRLPQPQRPAPRRP